MLEVVANAKINLFLEITGKLKNGYHTVDTVMQSVMIADTVKLELLSQNDGIKISCSDSDIPTDERNIAYKAARSFLSAAEAECGVFIDIVKHVPSQAGMGGGSADGAAVLLGLNQLCGSPFSVLELKEIASKLGADIPFCIDGGTQHLVGIGTETVDRLVSPDIYLIIAKPDAGISTPAAYGMLDLIHSDFYNHTPMLPDKTINALINGMSLQSSDTLFNRFEEVLPNLCAKSLDLINYIKSCGCNALLSGSGAAVFGIAENQKHAEKIASQINDYFPNCFTCVTKTANNGCCI